MKLSVGVGQVFEEMQGMKYQVVRVAGDVVTLMTAEGPIVRWTMKETIDDIARGFLVPLDDC